MTIFYKKTVIYFNCNISSWTSETFFEYKIFRTLGETYIRCYLISLVAIFGRNTCILSVF